MPCQFSNIVATQTFSNKTTALASTAIYTPSAKGVFRVSAVLECVSSGAQVQASASWTDGFAAQALGTIAFIDASGNVITKLGASAISVAAGDSISVSTSYPLGGSATYNLYVVVEQLI